MSEGPPSNDTVTIVTPECRVKLLLQERAEDDVDEGAEACPLEKTMTHSCPRSANRDNECLAELRWSRDRCLVSMRLLQLVSLTENETQSFGVMVEATKACDPIRQ